MDSQYFSLDGRDPPTNGDTGIFTLYYQEKNLHQNLRIKCHVSHVLGNGVGLDLNCTGLTDREIEIIVQIMDKGATIA
jgi:hypothetical protein